MKSIKFIAPAILAAFISIIMVSCSKSDPYTTPGGGVDTSVYKVNILATQFDPATTMMLVAYKIRWTNMDTDTHSIVSDDGTSFNSGNIPAGGSYTFTSVTTGTYAYHCGVHPGVTGMLYVVAR